MYPTGQYMTETELKTEIAELEKLGNEGKLTVPLANRLNRLRSELETIRNAMDPTNKPWPPIEKE